MKGNRLKTNKNNIIADIVISISAIILVLSIIYVIILIVNYSGCVNTYDEIRDTVYEDSISIYEGSNDKNKIDYMGVSIDLARNINKDTICWIYIPNTNIDYPVVKTNNNEKYLNTLFDGSEGMSGTLFVDSRVRDLGDNLVIYGHNMKDGSMFHDLRNYIDIDYRTEHKLAYISFGNYNAKEYNIRAVIETNSQDEVYEYIVNNDKKAYDRIRLMDEYNDIDINKDIVCLSTCEGSNDKRIIVILQGID